MQIKIMPSMITAHLKNMVIESINKYVGIMRTYTVKIVKRAIEPARH